MSFRGWLLLLLLGGCADLRRGDPASSEPASPGAGGTPGQPGENPSFATDVHGLLVAGCGGCHSQGGSAGDTGFVLAGDAEADYAEVVSLIDESAPADSRLLRKGGGQGHGGGAVYPTGSSEYESLLAWVQGGALP